MRIQTEGGASNKRHQPMRNSLTSLAVSLALIATAAGADPDADIQRALIERQQRADELMLRLQQSQPPPVPGNLRQQQELDQLHLQQLQRLQNLNTQQLRQFDTLQLPAADPNAARMLMLQQQQMLERDRQIELQQFRWDEQNVRDAQQRAPKEKPN